MPNESRDSTLGGLLQLITALENHKEELSHLDVVRLKLNALVEALQEVLGEQSTLIARKQEASQKATRLLGEVRKTATLLRVGVREHYGSDSERLAAFGLQPFRGRVRRKGPAEEEKTPAPVSEPAK